MKSNNEKDPLWDLLGTATNRKSDAFFGRNVVRELRNQEVVVSWWRKQRVCHAARVAACAALVVVFVTNPMSDKKDSAMLANQNADSIELSDMLFKFELGSLSDEELDYDAILNPISVVTHLDTSEYDAIAELLEL